ncbi:MAG: glycosyltransferase family 4 protein [Muribaculaceae bacterium]|nr:glycosyltransferase family 4 protein [Muribaculaceae bacterium]
MRILHLIRCKTWGGGERYALDLCERSAEEGHDVTVVSRGIPHMDAHFSHLPVEMVKMPLGGFLDTSSPRALARLIKSYPEDRVVVHVHNFKDAEIAARAKRLLPKGKRMWLVCTRHLIKPAKRSLRWKWIYKAIDRIIFISQLALNEFLASDPPIDRNKISIVHNSVIIPSSPPSAHDEHNGINILFTGRIAPEKGVDILIKSLAYLSDLPLRLRITGTGNEEYVTYLKRLADESGMAESIEWHGFVPDVFKEIAEADICVAPSTWREPFGLTIIEFMSQSRPVISTNNGAQSEIITDGKDGLLVPPSDAEALAKAIRRFAEDAALRKRIGEEALNTFRTRFAYDIFFRKILSLYTS